MDRLLRPQVFNIEPSHQDAAKLWTHFKRTFENFVNVIQTSEGTNIEELKLLTLTNYVSATVF